MSRSWHWGHYGISGFIGSLFERTKRAWLHWARWGDWELSQFHRIGADPARVPAEGSLCPICFSASIYVRKGARNRWMRGIATCRACHAPVLIQAPIPPKERETDTEKEKELVTVEPAAPERDDENVT